MPAMAIILDGEGVWPDLPADVIHLGNEAKPIQVAALPGGMSRGHPSIAFRFDLPDGRTVLAETSARIFCMAAKAIMARYPDLFSD